MKPYQPDKLPLDGLDYKRLLALVGDANAELARYDGLLQGIVNPAIMLSPLTNEEAVLSSKIEGTQATVDDVLEQEAGLLKDGEKAKDIQEIINYREALRASHQYLKERPITLAFVRELHKILLSSVRGQDKTPGEIRTEQNWIGRYGCTMEQASFVPPSPLQLQDHLDAWQAYLADDDIDILLQTAVMHAQFELLHPFKDGNGRIGRILIPLFLYQKKKISQPMFYLSAYLEAHREEYYSRLQAISRDGDWNSWIAFFLQAITEQAKNNSAKVKAIMGLYDDMKKQIHEITHSQYTVHLLDAIFDRPIFDSSHLVKHADIPVASVKSFIPKLKKAGILTEIRPARGRTPAVLAFGQLLNIAEGKHVF
ncbi:Fic family protein [Desulfoplanes formicivorans]|uniref:Cell filamentation protein Fic n=1 Tax=Desulfoplanes formicivorans TaxID=1592317 RepID=A0A194AID9_9BACT|nr:Fic/DOC family N-terminal domain-containing protein [Desulfoplanes formicivorans]GAU09093.1 cell filamentation protein Fic [Desulfoplanes formicivorans]